MVPPLSAGSKVMLQPLPNVPFASIITFHLSVSIKLLHKANNIALFSIYTKTLSCSSS